MRFQVPQFIEVEDKIFGPLTIKQFIYLVGGAGLSFIAYTFIKPIYISILIILPILGFTLALAFYKINNKPFINVVEASFYYFFNNKLYIWRKVDKKIQQKTQDPNRIQGGAAIFVPKLSDSKLKDLAWSLDVNEKSDGTIYSKENQTLEKKKTYINPF